MAAVIATVRFSIRPELAELAVAGEWRLIESRVARIATYTTGLAVVSIIGILALGPVLIPILFGERYAGIESLVAMLLLGTVGESLGGPIDEVLKMSGDAYFVLLVQIGGTAVAFAFEALGALLYSNIGLAVAYALGFILIYAVMIARLWVTRHVLALPRFPRRTVEG
ncbi:hypothetical protein GCM10009573_07910 [Agromyces bracchium]